MRARRIALVLLTLLTAAPLPARADAGFEQFLRALRPQAEQFGISRAVFDHETRDLKPDYSLPDLVVPGRPKVPDVSQPEFVQTPAAYLRESSLERLAREGRALAGQHRATLARIERDFGVPGPVVLAIWGRETAYGSHKLGHDAIRVLATQAYVGRRKDQFREEFLYGLKMIQERQITRDKMRSSWAGAMGLTQFLPSEFYKHAVDFDGDGKRDIFTSVPDALASAAKQLVNKGWQRDRHWAYEVRTPREVDCTIAQPGHSPALGSWLERGYVTIGRKPAAAELGEPASLLMPEGTYGPAFLTLKNYYVIKDYNFSDLYVLFVGNLADRIAGGAAFITPWSKNAQLPTLEVERMQQKLTQLGLYQDKIDGKAGMLTRSAVGAYQKANRMKLDCWPTRDVVEHMKR